jgi:hypothetical protein
MKLLSIISIFIFISACSGKVAQINNQKVSSSPSPKPTISKEESEKKEKAETEQKQKAINDFIAQNYKGWKLEGVASDSFSNECEENSPCDVHLINGSQTKVVTLVLKEFYKSDGTKYWLVWEARQIDLAKSKIEAIKDRERESVLADLTIDDIGNDLKAEIVEQDNETQEIPDLDYSDAPDGN